VAAREERVTEATGAVKRASGPVRDLNRPRSFVLHEDALRTDLSPRELAEAVAAGTTLWVDVDVSSRHQVAVLEKVFGFHPLSVEDALSPNSRVKVEEYPGYLFMIVRGVRFCDETSEDPYDTETFNLSFFLGKNYLVSVHGRHAEPVQHVVDLVTRTPELLARGPGRLLHLMMDASIDAYFPIVDQIDEFVDGLEERVFARFDESAMRDIFSVKRLVLSLRRHLAPQREVFNILSNRPTSLLAPEAQVYFRDIYDHVLRINEGLETYRELLSATLESYLTQVSNRLGSITKGLSVIGALSVPFVVVSGMWGMNFSHIPMSENPWGFWIMLVLQLALGGLLVGLLRWRRLL
jgi:magnesium transporter